MVDLLLVVQVLSQEETPFLYSIVFGEGVVNDATSIVLYNAVQSLNFNNIDAKVTLNLLGNFLYLFFTSTALGIVVSHAVFYFYWLVFTKMHYEAFLTNMLILERNPSMILKTKVLLLFFRITEQ